VPPPPATGPFAGISRLGPRCATFGRNLGTLAVTSPAFGHGQRMPGKFTGQARIVGTYSHE
jgi:hypothetical protein